MFAFQNEAQAEKTKESIQKLTDSDLSSFWRHAFASCPDPDLALINLERWLRASSNSDTQLAHLSSAPKLARVFIKLIGASQRIADALIQSPELAHLIMDPAELARTPDTGAIVREGRVMVAAVHSYQHKLDRLRFLKQRWIIPIAVNDLVGSWAPEVVWKALSDLADAIVSLAGEIAWADYAERKRIGLPCPIMTVAFGKLGGHELNYSSDVDLVYVLDDDAEELQEHAARFCEMLNRALADQMGRGALYRVDLRLRPFGGAGPVAPTMRSVETYYRSYAEQWEAQALVRSRPICGMESLRARWEALIAARCFPKNLSEMAVASMLVMRRRIEDRADELDLKRGPGGIRDVEFITQVLQMLHGHAHADVRVKSTVTALKSLAAHGLLRNKEARELIEGYTFLRQLEHRCQLANDQQTHMLPSTEPARRHVAVLMGFSQWNELEHDLDRHRRQINKHYNELLCQHEAPNPRAKVLARLDPLVRQQVAQWFDGLPQAEVFYQSAFENSESLARLGKIVRRAPILVSRLAVSVALTESILSGEVEEQDQNTLPFPNQARLEMLGQTAAAHWTAALCRWALIEKRSEPLGHTLTHLGDMLLRTIARGTEAVFDVVALGSYGSHDLAANSDMDILLLASDEVFQSRAEEQAQRFLADLLQLKRYGWIASPDLRLRPEGTKGLLVRTYAGLKSYELERMEMWERFALGNARLVCGNPEALDVTLKAAYAMPLTPEALADLVAMKHRIETERVKPQHWKRDVKLGFGGLSDIEWFVHLHEMRYPTVLEAGRLAPSGDRLMRMVAAGLINALEYDQLTRARMHLLDLRNAIYLLEFTPDILPENPDKLERLSEALGAESGYDLQRVHLELIESVRTIYLEGLERLGV